MFDKETIRAERLLRIKTAVGYLPFKLERETRHGFFHPQLVTVLGADRANRTGEERLISLMGMPLIGRLCGDRGKIADLFETHRRQLPARVAVDAGRIDIKVASDIGVESLFLIGHGSTFMH
jgi:hypothetical protein